MALLRIISWNLNNQIKRKNDLLSYVIEFEKPDQTIVLFQELNQANISLFDTKLGCAGFSRLLCSKRDKKGVVGICATVPLQDIRLSAPELDDCRTLLVRANVGSSSIDVLNVHIPEASRRDAPRVARKEMIFKSVVDYARRSAHQPFLIMGDFNTGHDDYDVVRVASKGCPEEFTAGQHFNDIHDFAFDAWRREDNCRRGCSWRTYSDNRRSDVPFGSRLNEFRIDHSFVSFGLRERVSVCEYDLNSSRYEPGELRLTDHLLMYIDLDV